MSGAQFEVFMADLFGALGHKAVVLGGAGDQGVDIVVNRRGERVAVQCKNHKKAVGNKPVQEVYAEAKHHRCVETCVVAPAGYTRGPPNSPGARASRCTTGMRYGGG
jgi:restriction system protein